MKTLRLLLVLWLFPYGVAAQETQEDPGTIINGVVINDATDKILENVNIVNLNKVIGTTTDGEGEFKFGLL